MILNPKSQLCFSYHGGGTGDIKVMPEIPYEKAYYIFDRGYNDFR